MAGKSHEGCRGGGGALGLLEAEEAAGCALESRVSWAQERMGSLCTGGCFVGGGFASAVSHWRASPVQACTVRASRGCCWPEAKYSDGNDSPESRRPSNSRRLKPSSKALKKALWSKSRGRSALSGRATSD